MWALDAVSALHSELSVEPASLVAARTAAVVQRARKEVSIRQRYHTGDGQPFPSGPSAVVLVSHGDALQLLQCLLAGRPLEQHRSLPHLENCGIRALRPPPEKEGTEIEGEAGGEEWGAGGDGGEEASRSKNSVEMSAPFAMKRARVLRPRTGRDEDNSSNGSEEQYE